MWVPLMLLMFSMITTSWANDRTTILKFFHSIDINDDGKITIEEVMKDVFLAFDTDKNKIISESEFSTSYEKLPETSAHAKYIFDDWNIVKDGASSAGIDLSDLLPLLIKMDNQHTPQIAHFDNSVVEEDEFVMYMSQLYLMMP